MPYSYDNPYGLRRPNQAPAKQPQPGEFEKGLRRFALGVSPAIDRTQAAVQGAIGFDEAAQANLEDARQAEIAAQDPALAPRIGRVEDVKSLGDFGDYAAGIFGQNLPLFGSMALTGGAAGLTGRVLAGARALKPAAYAGAAAPYLTQTVSEASQNIVDDPEAEGSFQARSLGALATGGAQTALGMSPIGIGAKMLRGPGSRLARAGKAAGVSAATEAATEVGEELIGRYGHRQFNPSVELFDDEAQSDYLNAAVGGALLGAPLGGIAGFVAPKSLTHSLQTAVEDGRSPIDAAEDYIGQNIDILDDDQVFQIRDHAQSFQPIVPRGTIEKKLSKIEADEELNLEYSRLFGVSADDYHARKAVEYQRQVDQVAARLLTGRIKYDSEEAQAYPRAKLEEAVLRLSRGPEGLESSSDLGSSIDPNDVYDSQNYNIEDPQSDTYHMNFYGLPWKSDPDSRKALGDTAIRMALERIPVEEQREFARLRKSGDEAEARKYLLERTNLRTVTVREMLTQEARENGIQDVDNYIIDRALDMQYQAGNRDILGDFDIDPEAVATELLDNQRVLAESRMPSQVDPNFDETIDPTHFGDYKDASTRRARRNEQVSGGFISDAEYDNVVYGPLSVVPSEAKAILAQFNKASPVERERMFNENPVVEEVISRMWEVKETPDLKAFSDRYHKQQQIKRSKRGVLRPDNRESSDKRIDVDVYDPQTGEVKRQKLDVMQAAIEAQKKIPFDSKNPQDSMMKQIVEGVASALTSRTKRMRLTRNGIPGDTVVYTKNGRQIKWREVEKWMRTYKERGLSEGEAEQFGVLTSDSDQYGQKDNRDRTPDVDEGLEHRMGVTEPTTRTGDDLRMEGGYPREDPGPYYGERRRSSKDIEVRDSKKIKEELERVNKRREKLGLEPLPPPSFLSTIPKSAAEDARQARLKYEVGVKAGKIPRKHVIKNGDLEKSEVPGTDERINKILKADDSMRRDRHTRVVRELARRVGVSDNIRILDVREAQRIYEARDKDGRFVNNSGFTTIVNGQRVIYVNPTLPEAAALEALSHEFGHAVIDDTWESAPRKVKRAVLKAHKEWRSQFNGDSTLYDVLSTRLPQGMLHNQLFRGSLDKALSDLNSADQEYLLSFKEWFADNVAKWVVSDAKPVSLVDQFFKHVADLIKDLWNGAVKAVNTPDKTVQQYMDAVFSEKPTMTLEPVLAFSLSEVPGVNPNDASVAAAEHGPGWTYNNTVTEIYNAMEHLLTGEEMNVLGKAAQSGVVRRQMQEFYRHDPSALDILDRFDTQESVVLLYKAWRAGAIDLSKRQDSIFRKFMEAMAEILGVVMNSKNAETLMAMISQGTLPSKVDRPSYVQTRVNDTAIQQGRKYIEAVGKPAVDLLVKVAGSAETQMRHTGNAALTALWRQMYASPDTSGGREGFFSARHRMRGRFETILHKIYDQQDEAFGARVLSILHKEVPYNDGTAAEKKAVDDTRKLLEAMYKYVTEAGVDVRHKKDYFPRVYDIETITKRGDEFVKMLTEKYEKELIEYGKAMRKEGQKEPTAEEVARRIQRAMVKQDGDEIATVEQIVREDGDDPLGWPAAGMLKERSLGFLKDEDIAPFLNKDLGLTLSTYINQVVKRAEYNRRFGIFTGQKMVTAYLDEAKATGATDADIDRARKAVEAALGTLGADINPTLHQFQGWVMVMENWMLLGMSTITSLVDPIGIAVRGDLETAWTALKAGLNEVKAAVKGDETQLSRMASLLGVNEMHNTIEALGYEYGGYYVTGTARRWNDRLFSINGLNKWTRMTRTMALAGAQQFIAKHGNGKYDKNSRRYLTELGLREGDVKVDKDGKLIVLSNAQREALERRVIGGEKLGTTEQKRKEDRKDSVSAKDELARDDRVRMALNRWVDEAILRPDAAQRPIWASDPHWMLIFHLKAFTYSFHERILRRVGHEIAGGNYKPAVALLGYLPAMFIAEGLRNTLQGDDMDDSIGEDAGFFETAHYLAQRSGVYGVGQFAFDVSQGSRYGDTPFSVLGGPALDHVLTIAEAVSTEKTSDDEYAVMRSLPFHNLYQDWFK